MAPRSTRTARSIVAKATELSMAASQVVAHRVARMALSGPAPNARDRKEFQLMVKEKEAAFAQAWAAMATQSVRANQALATSLFRSVWSLSPRRKPSPGAVALQFQSAALGILGKGSAPVHRKAVANARRLARTKLR
jgi:hypothetical protein